MPLYTAVRRAVAAADALAGLGSQHLRRAVLPEQREPVVHGRHRTMWDGFGRSVNTYFVQLEEQVGADKAVAMAQRLGITFRAAERPAAGQGRGRLGVVHPRRRRHDPARPGQGVRDGGGGGRALRAAAGDLDHRRRPARRSPAWPTRTAGRVISPDDRAGRRPTRRAARSASSPRSGGATAGPRPRSAGSSGRPVAGKTGARRATSPRRSSAFTPQVAAAGIAADPADPTNAVGSGVSKSVNAAVAHTIAVAVQGLPVQDFTPPSVETAFGPGGIVPVPQDTNAGRRRSGGGGNGGGNNGGGGKTAAAAAAATAAVAAAAAAASGGGGPAAAAVPTAAADQTGGGADQRRRPAPTGGATQTGGATTAAPPPTHGGGTGGTGGGPGNGDERRRRRSAHGGGAANRRRLPATADRRRTGAGEARVGRRRATGVSGWRGRGPAAARRGRAGGRRACRRSRQRDRGGRVGRRRARSARRRRRPRAAAGRSAPARAAARSVPVERGQRAATAAPPPEPNSSTRAAVGLLQPRHVLDHADDLLVGLQRDRPGPLGHLLRRPAAASSPRAARPTAPAGPPRSRCRRCPAAGPSAARPGRPSRRRRGTAAARGAASARATPPAVLPGREHADRDHPHAVGLRRQDHLLDLGRPAGDAQHPRHAVPVDVGVDDADRPAPVGQRRPRG